MNLDAGAVALTLLGMVVAGLGTAAAEPRAGLLLLLDLWTGAGLVRLSSDLDWKKLATAALVIAIRKLTAHRLKPPAALAVHRDR
jgi:hypothetical protein